MLIGKLNEFIKEDYHNSCESLTDNFRVGLNLIMEARLSAKPRFHSEVLSNSEMVYCTCAVVHGIEYMQCRNIDVFSEDIFWIDVAFVILPLHQLESPEGILSFY